MLATAKNTIEITYEYDDLNRVIKKTVVETAESDTQYWPCSPAPHSTTPWWRDVSIRTANNNTKGV